MKFATIDKEGGAVAALCTEDGVYDLSAVLERLPSGRVEAFGLRSGEPLTMLKLIAAGPVGLELGREVVSSRKDFANARRELRDVRLLAPIPRPPKNIFCLGRNYAEHIQEDNVSRDQATELPQHAQFFTKPPTSVIGPGGEIRYDEKVTRRLDYEVELAVVIGAVGRDIPVDRAYEHVFGYTIVNDITARDLQKRHDQWFKGKGLDTSCPMGPWIVTADEIPDPHGLRIQLSVNGEPRQDASTGDMIFRIPETIASLSAGLTLEPGDVIATGTPSGVGYAMNPRRWLTAGDEIVCTIEGVGILTNKIVAI